MYCKYPDLVNVELSIVIYLLHNIVVLMNKIRPSISYIKRYGKGTENTLNMSSETVASKIRVNSADRGNNINGSLKMQKS